MAGECDTVLVEKSEGKRPFDRPRRRWGLILKRKFKEKRWESGNVGRIDLDQLL
jgi:hypothetical protein